MPWKETSWLTARCKVISFCSPFLAITDFQPLKLHALKSLSQLLEIFFFHVLCSATFTAINGHKKMSILSRDVKLISHSLLSSWSACVVHCVRPCSSSFTSTCRRSTLDQKFRLQSLEITPHVLELCSHYCLLNCDNVTMSMSEITKRQTWRKRTHVTPSLHFNIKSCWH